jgi:CHASE2 domain-containing sensor protein
VIRKPLAERLMTLIAGLWVGALTVHWAWNLLRPAIPTVLVLLGLTIAGAAWTNHRRYR